MNLGNDDDSSTLKKLRVVWSLDLHLQFIQAINQLGIDKAVPKEILELMNVPGSLEKTLQVTFWLMAQKYRFYLKRLSGVLLQPNSLSSGYMQENLLGNPHNNPLVMHMAQSQSHSLAQMLNEISISQESALPSPIGQLGLTNGISVGVLTRSGSPENGRGSGQTSFNSGS